MAPERQPASLMVSLQEHPSVTASPTQSLISRSGTCRLLYKAMLHRFHRLHQPREQQGPQGEHGDRDHIIKREDRVAQEEDEVHHEIRRNDQRDPPDALLAM